MSNSNPKKSIRGPEEFWEKYDDFVESSNYSNRSDAARDALRMQMNQDSDKISFDEELYDAFSTYASGLADRNERVAAVGLDLLYDIDDQLGRLAEEELDKIE